MGVTFGVGLELSGFSPNPNSLPVFLFSPFSFLLCLGISVGVRVKCWNGSSMVYYACGVGFGYLTFEFCAAIDDRLV